MAKKKAARKRARTRSTTTDKSSSGSDASWGAAGEDARAEMERARAEAAHNRSRGYMPMRFFQKPMNEAEIVILDDDLHSFMGNEHHLKHPKTGKWGNFESCCNQYAHCAICENFPDHPSYRVLLLTVLVRESWTDKKGNEHKYSRMLLPIKQGQHERFIEIERIAKKNSPSESLRGVMLRMRRSKDKQSINIGEPTAFEDGNLLDYYTEGDLEEEFGHDEIKDRDGNVVVEENGYLQPFDYLELFPKPDPEDIAARYGGGTVAGSSADHDEAFGSEEEEADDDEVPMHHSFSDKGAAADSDDVSDEDAEAFEGELTAKAEEHDLDINDFPTWKELGEEIDSKEATPKSRPKTKKTARKRSRSRRGQKEPFA